MAVAIGIFLKFEWESSLSSYEIYLQSAYPPKPTHLNDDYDRDLFGKSYFPEVCENFMKNTSNRNDKSEKKEMLMIELRRRNLKFQHSVVIVPYECILDRKNVSSKVFISQVKKNLVFNELMRFEKHH